MNPLPTSRMADPDKAADQAFARIFSYPDEDCYTWIRECGRLLCPDDSASQVFRRFADFALAAPLEELEELFVQTFEMTRQRALEIGWHLYGEQYKRGEFLVRMRSLLRRYGIAESLELPDHLSHCLLLLPHLEEREALQFVRSSLRPALERIRQGFEQENPYRYAIDALCRSLDRRFTPDVVNPET